MLPRGLRFWFVVHFAADVLFAVPLLLWPEWTMRLFGWTTVDPFATRLVGAALMAIGVQSLLGRNEGPDTYRAFLNLKIIWSLCAIAGIAATLARGGQPRLAWAFLAVFAAFSVLWIQYRVRLGRRAAASGPGATV